MADFDVFGEAGGASDPEVVDPAAEFLADQQQKLAGLMDDDFDGFGGNSQGGAAIGQEQPNFLADVPQPAADNNLFSGGDSFGGFDQVDQYAPAAPAAPFAPAPAAQPTGYADVYSAIRSEMGESDKLRQWREAHRERVTKKDADEDIRRKEGYANAKRELEDWYKHYNEQVGRTRAANLDMEKMLIAERNEPLPTGADLHPALWDRVARLCEFNPKNSKCQKDVTRFRSLLLQLKQTPPIRT